MANIVNVNSVASLGKKVHKGSLLIRFIFSAVVVVSGFLLGLYGASALVTEHGEYTISIADKDKQSSSISLCETTDFLTPTVNLKCPGVESMTNISGKSLPTGIDDTDGSHNGEHYVAYTFYLKNNSQNQITINESMKVDSTVLGADQAIRVRVYKDGIYNTYAQVSKNGTPEYGTIAFDGNYVFNDTVTMSPQKINKYTIVIWLEGDDPECLDNIKGGAVNLSMAFSIVEATT